jgi:hypothetical protein
MSLLQKTLLVLARLSKRKGPLVHTRGVISDPTFWLQFRHTEPYYPRGMASDHARLMRTNAQTVSPGTAGGRPRMLLGTRRVSCILHALHPAASA